MVFGLFKKKDPICGMKETKGKGIIDDKTNNWFCSKNCQDEFNKNIKDLETKKSKHGGSCCN